MHFRHADLFGHRRVRLCLKVANLANKMPEKHGIAEGHVLGPVIFKMCTVDFFCAYGLTLNTTKWELFVVRKVFAN